MAARAMDKRGVGRVGWDEFEEKARLVFVLDAPGARLAIKTRVGGPPKRPLRVVARVVHESLDVASYQTSEPAHMPRLARLLRFAMQEVLGPMRATPATPATPAARTPASAPSPAAAASAPESAAKSKKKKKGKKKH